MDTNIDVAQRESGGLRTRGHRIETSHPYSGECKNVLFGTWLHSRHFVETMKSTKSSVMKNIQSFRPCGLQGYRM